MKKIAIALVVVLGAIGSISALCAETADSNINWVAFVIAFSTLLTCYILADTFIWNDKK